MNFAHSKTYSLFPNFMGRFQTSNPASSPKVCGMLEYKLTTSNITSKVSSHFSLEHFDKKSLLECTECIANTFANHNTNN